MPLPRAVARFNKRFTNHLLEPVARRTAGFAVIHHAGRRSGRTYATPVTTFALDDDMVVALTYGPGADWVQNVLAGPARYESRARFGDIVSAEVVDRSVAWPALPFAVRIALRLLRVRHFFRLTVSGGIKSL